MMQQKIKRRDPLRFALALAGLLSIFFVNTSLSSDFSNSDCLDCHEKTTDEIEQSYDGSLNSSAHQGFDCTDCHSMVTELPHQEDLTRVTCHGCHDEQEENYKYHGRLQVPNGADIPKCFDCHGKHDILPSDDKYSRTHPTNLPETCGKCHEDLDLIRKHEIYFNKPIEVYKSSVHGKASLGGIYVAATCNDCHSTTGSAHNILSPGSPESAINHFNIPNTCGECHKAIEKDYWEGIHGKLAARGETDSPVCTHCHGEHGIISPSDPSSPVSPSRLAEATCSPCHESAYLNEKYGLPVGRFKSFIDSYHGLKSKAGDPAVANCASCHGAHRILPHSDPASSIYPDNLQKTCGHCHPGISTQNASVRIHQEPGVAQTDAGNIFQAIYIVAIIIIIGLMVIHWLIDLRKQLRVLLDKNQVKRMSLNELWQHNFLMVSFIALAITGFSLRYAQADWVRFLFGWEGGFPLRGIIHRVAAALFIFTTIWHCLFLTTRNGRQFLKDIFPEKKDFVQFVRMMKFNLGLRKEKPEFGRFSYIEKAEYWALVWGTAIMIFSGFFLWFDDLASHWFPKGFLDVMIVIHHYEAWLAVLAVAIWHFYSVIFKPGIYPMNPSWMTGKMPVEQYEEEHGMEMRSKEKEALPEKTDEK